MSEPWLSLAALGGAGASPSLAVLVARQRDRRRWQAELIRYQVEFAGEIEAAQMTAFLGGLSGLLPARWRLPLVTRGMGFEIVATPAGVRHYLLVPASQAEIVQSHLRAALPNVGLSPDREPALPTPTLAGELMTANPHHPLNVSSAEAVAAAILAAAQPLGDGEAMTLQWLVRPLGSRSAQRDTFDPATWIARLAGSPPPSLTPPPKAVQDKYRHPLFAAAGRLGVTSASRARDHQLLARLTAAFHAANSPDATLKRRPVPSARVARALVRRRPPLVGWPCHLNAPELAALVAWPPAGLNLPGLATRGSRKLAPSAQIPQTGKVIADSNYPGMQRPLALPLSEATGHVYLIGPSGRGKSTLGLNLILQDAAAGHGLIVVDAAEDLVRDVTDRLSADREVIILDCCDDERPVGLNLLAGAAEAPELVAEQVLSVWHRLYRSSWGPRSDDILRSALLTLVGVPGMTICELPLLLTDEAFRRRLVGRLDDPVGLGPFWAAYEAMSDAERAQAIGPVMNKLRSVLVRPRLRRVLGQANPRLDLDQALASGAILLVPLAKGLIGEDAAALLGSLLIARLWQAVQHRTALPERDRRPVFCYIDEFQDFLNLPTPMPELVAQARKLGLGLVLMHQHLAQLDTDLREAVIANCRSRVIFQTTSSDARRLAREVEPYLSAQDLQHLGPHEVAISLSIDSRTLPPVTGVTRPKPAPLGHADEIRERSRQRYGRPAAEIDAELRARHERATGSGPVGRQRRSP